MAAQSGNQSAGQPSSDWRLPATVTEPTAGCGGAVVTDTGSLVSCTTPCSLRIAR